MNAGGSYDLILKGGRVIDPGSGVDGIFDVAIIGSQIAAVETELRGSEKIINVTGKMVLPGLIDTHAHVFQYVTGRFGLEADMVGVRSGVTTLVDQGGPSCMTFPAFRQFIAKPAASRVLTFISIYVVGGLEGHFYPDLYSPTGVDVDATKRVVCENTDLVRGIKAHAEIGGFERWGIEVIRLAAEAGQELDLPIYIHFGQLWPRPGKPTFKINVDKILPDVVELMRPGDILAHPFTRHPGGFVNLNGDVHPIIAEALAKGLKIDVGHGSHFSFDMAKQVLDAGILPHTLGADMHGYNTSIIPPPGTPAEHPDEELHSFGGQAQFSLVHAMSELLALGVPMEQVVSMVTINCAKMLGTESKFGTLAVGAMADISVLNDLSGQWTLVDNSGTKIKTDRLLTPAFCLKSGVRHDADSPLLPQPELISD